MVNAIDRLGFESWANNLIVNAIENLNGTNGADKHFHSTDERTVCGEIKDGCYNFTVRAYVPNRGWHEHSISIKKTK